MRIVLKPGGLFVLLIAVIGLACFAFRANTPVLPAAAPTPAAVPASATPVVSASGAAAPLATASAELLSAPDAASAQWEVLNGGGAAAAATVQTVPSDLAGHADVRRVTVRKAGNAWDVQLRQLVPKPIARGTALTLSVRARSKTGAKLVVVCEHHADPYEKLVSKEITTTPEWVWYHVSWTADRDVPAGWAHVSLQFGAAGEIDIAEVSLHPGPATNT